MRSEVCEHVKNYIGKTTHMKRILFVATVFVTCLGQKDVQAQYDFTIQGMTIVPQRNYINPAYIPDSKWHLGLPMLSSNHIAGGFGGFAYSDLIRKSGDSLKLDIGNAIDMMGTTGYFSMNANFDLLSFSFKFGKEKNNFIYVNVTERLSVKATLPKSLPEFAWRGNAAFLGQEVDFSKLNADATHYREYGITYARTLLDKKLNVGLTAKYLYGMENVSTDNRGITVFTDENTFDITAKSDFTINSSGTFGGEFEEIGNDVSGYLFNRNNHGFAFNLGAQYKITEKWEVAVSALDLGMIFWNEKPTNFVMDKADFTYQGLDIAQFLAQDSTDYLENFLDSIASTFDVTETNQSYTSAVPSRIYISGAYNINKNNRVGLDFYGEIFKGHFEPAVSINYTKRFGHIFAISGSYMYNNRSWANLGAGFSLTLGPLQWYLTMDNILAPIIPQHVQNFHFHSGLNMVFGYKDKGPKILDRDADGVPDTEDACPDEYGLKIFNGCPDRDWDGIPDKDDNCPDVQGPVANKGCPWGDRDGDGVLDNEDQCIDEPGDPQNFGCPWGDRDGDGVTDNIDRCPDEAGDPANEGCPWGDKDGDGVLDNEDRCPEIPGAIENAGCPWGDRDGDGVPDNIDRCPEVGGPGENDGCPWPDTDGDGVYDHLDECPRTPGPAENRGCPVIEKTEQEVLKVAFDNLEFETGKDLIKASSYRSLDELAELLKRKPDYKLKISGHTDNVGRPESNLLLSEKRARAVEKYLSNKGVDAARLKVLWFGQAKPAYPNDTTEGRQRNRRVEMEVVFD
jgi:outer membrane protein OmpA-like peptidoglycan-associated protein